jgi:hypothetical protein
MMPINTRHLCCIDLAGAAHVAIIEQPNPGQYDRERLRRIQMDYFTGYLLAVLQRQSLQQIIEESVAVSRLSCKEQSESRNPLLEKVLRFGLEGEFVQVSWRTPVQKHHELAQKACGIHEGLATARQAIAEFHQMAAAEEAKKRKEESELTERSIHLLEVFIVTFYSVELAHILGEAFQFGHTPFLAWSLIGVALSSFLMGSLLVSWTCLKEWRPIWTIVALFAMATLIHAAFLGANWWESASHRVLPAAPSGTPTREHEPQENPHP